MNTYHQKLLEEIKKHAKNKNPLKLTDTYAGNSHLNYAVPTVDLRMIAKRWAKLLEDRSEKDIIAFFDSIFSANSYQEKSLGGIIFKYSKKLRAIVKPEYINRWLEQLQGWAEIDSLCQSNFTARDLLSEWNGWEKQLIYFSKSDHVNKNRASLVLLTGPVSKSEDKRLSDLSFQNMQTLQNKKDILITKAISWLLRDLIKHHRKEVEAFLEKHKDTLPKIAIREPKRKLLTGKK